MKSLTVIWGMIILLLACLPCTDSGTAVAQDQRTVVQAADACNDASHASDVCSPLCECNCCGSITLAISLPALPAPKPLMQSAFVRTHIPGGAVSPSFPFWHPPKA